MEVRLKNFSTKVCYTHDIRRRHNLHDALVKSRRLNVKGFLMAKNEAAAGNTQKAASPAKTLANRMKAVEDAGNMTPKMQRNFDRFAAKINK